MLYNPKWEVKTKPDCSLESLIAWLEKQPSDATYNFFKHGDCLLAQYFKSHGFSDIQVGGHSYRTRGIKRPLSEAFQSIAVPETSWRFWRSTFGAALKRARALA